MDLEWTRPAALVSLALPALVVLLSLRPERPTPLASGTFSLWRERTEAVRGGGRRRRLPPERVLIVLALACAAVALAGPRRRAQEPPRTWQVIVDASPSMHLEHSGGRTRLEQARRTLEELAREEGVGLRWTLDGEVLHEELDEGWRTAGPPRWAAFDVPGAVWLTDRVPEEPPRQAGLVASGGPAVPGPVGTVGTRWLDWTGASLVERDGAPTRRVVVDDSLPAPIRAVARAWAEERGLASPTGEVALEVLRVEGPGTEVLAGRDGWRASGRGCAAPAGTTWLAAGERPLVTWRPGAVAVALQELSPPEGDPAAWAVSWSRLLDGALAPAFGVVPLDERGEAGEPVLRGPHTGGGVAPPRPPRWPLVALLAALAAGLGFLALVLGRGRL